LIEFAVFTGLDLAVATDSERKLNGLFFMACMLAPLRDDKNNHQRYQHTDQPR